MPTNTPKFNLIKPLKSEKYNVDVFNGNADIIDSQIYSKTEVDTALNGKVNTTTTVNNQPLSSNIIINASGVPNTPAGNISATNVQNALNELDTEKANRTQEAWITPTLLNGWRSMAGREIQYMKDEMGFVHFRGDLDPSTRTSSGVFEVPIGYRPSRNEFINIGDTTNFISCLTTGLVSAATITWAWQSLSSFKYRAI